MRKIKLQVFLLILFLGFLSVQVVFAQTSAQSVEKPDEPAFPRPGDPALMSKTIRGATVRIIGFRRKIERVFDDATGKNVRKQIVELDVCHSIPDAGEWTLYGKSDMFQFQNVSSDTWRAEVDLANIRPATADSEGEGCKRFEFRFDENVQLIPPIRIEISELYTTQREIETYCQFILQRISTNPFAKAAGLQVECEEPPTANSSESGTGKPSIRLTGYDSEKITKQEAHVLLLEIESGVIYGPWVFRIHPTN